jgi:prepilin-type N-terminal cleavage/methylation domain-containing protein
MRRSDYRKAFSLVELLVVVAIISLLTAIAVPNFLSAQTRAKVARVQADLRTLATGLEMYATDNGSYIPMPIMLPPRFRSFIPLTSPVAYLSSIPRDPFKPEDSRGHGPWRRGMYLYGGTPIDNPSVWALASDGPDRQHDTEGLPFYEGYSPDIFDGSNSNFHFILYDPTNGTVSRGDILRAQDYIPQ